MQKKKSAQRSIMESYWNLQKEKQREKDSLKSYEINQTGNPNLTGAEGQKSPLGRKKPNIQKILQRGLGAPAMRAAETISPVGRNIQGKAREQVELAIGEGLRGLLSLPANTDEMGVMAGLAGLGIAAPFALKGIKGIRNLSQALQGAKVVEPGVIDITNAVRGPLDFQRVGGKALFNKQAARTTDDMSGYYVFQEYMDSAMNGLPINKSPEELIQDARKIRRTLDTLEVSQANPKLKNMRDDILTLFDEGGYPKPEVKDKWGVEVNLDRIPSGFATIGDKFKEGVWNIKELMSAYGAPTGRLRNTLNTSERWDPLTTSQFESRLANPGNAGYTELEDVLLKRINDQFSSAINGQGSTLRTTGLDLLDQVGGLNVAGRLGDLFTNLGRQASFAVEPIESGVRGGVLKALGLPDTNVSESILKGYANVGGEALDLPNRFGNSGLNLQMMNLANAPTKAGWTELGIQRAISDNMINSPIQRRIYPDKDFLTLDVLDLEKRLTGQDYDEARRFADRMNFEGPNTLDPLIQGAANVVGRVPVIGKSLQPNVLRYGNRAANLATDAIERTPIGIGKAFVDLGLANKARGGSTMNPIDILLDPVLTPYSQGVNKLQPDDIRKFADTLGKGVAGTTYLGLGGLVASNKDKLFPTGEYTPANQKPVPSNPIERLLQAELIRNRIKQTLGIGF